VSLSYPITGSLNKIIDIPYLEYKPVLFPLIKIIGPDIVLILSGPFIVLLPKNLYIYKSKLLSINLLVYYVFKWPLMSQLLILLPGGSMAIIVEY
jgi:hypothetical protein